MRQNSLKAKSNEYIYHQSSIEMKMENKIADQLRQPTGFLGKLLSKFLKWMNKRIYLQMVDEVNAKDGDKIFEIGYGHGVGVYRLANSANCFVGGIDYSEVMYKDAIKLNAKHIANQKVELSFGDFLESRVLPQFYNKVFCVNVIYFWDDLKAPFSKVKECMVEGGVFWIYMDSKEEIENSRFTNKKNFNLYDVEFVTQKLREVGFTVSHYDFGRGHIIKSLA